ncbi:MAG: hypothetical protein PHC93_05005, partial [Candidatus Omnitrophica bacterium]|nr:hypothetical protein [Candidatus Omnitrophota bacterium]
TDFVKDFLVNYKLIPVDGMPYTKWYRKTQHWAQPDIKHASSLMRFVFDNYPTAQIYALNNQKNVQQNFNSEVVINKLVRFLNE